MNARCQIAKRMDSIAPFYVMELLTRAKELEAEGRKIIHMEVGEPDFPLPAQLVEAGQQAFASDVTGYTAANGIPELRNAISRYYLDYGVEISPQRILVTPGSSAALQMVIGVTVNSGEEVIMTDPTYPCNKHFVLAFGGIPKLIPVGAESAYQLTAEMVEKAWNNKTRAVMVASPSNPTGTLIEKEELQKILSVVRKRGGILIVDEIYHKLLYQTQSYTSLSLGNDIFVINSFSKYYGMTGMRVGWVVAPEEAIDPLIRLTQNLIISTTTPSQFVALRAMKPDCTPIFEQRRKEFEKRRDFLYPALLQLGFQIPVQPTGAFYIYADCSNFTNDSYKFCHEILEETGVAITPGKDFGSYRANEYVRFAYTNKIDKISEGINRLESFLRKL